MNALIYHKIKMLGKWLSEVLIFASTNPQNDNILFIEWQVQYVKIPSSEYGENMLRTEIDFDVQNNLCTQHVFPMFCKIRTSDKDLPVLFIHIVFWFS